MSYWVKTVLGLGLFLGSLFAFEYALWELMNTGTCASGGPYVSARECPDGTLGKALLIPGSFIAGSIGVLIFALRGERPGASGRPRVSGVLLAWVGLFVLTGIVALVAGLTSDGPDAGTARWTGIFLAALFVPMGLAPVALVRAARGTKS